MGAQLKRATALLLAYLGAVSSASLASIVLITTFSLWSNPPAYDLSAANIFWFLILAFVFCAPMTGAAALGPFLITQKLAEAFSIRHPWYFIVAGALIGLLLSPLAVYLVTSGRTLISLELFLVSAASLMPGGAIGGFVYWLIDGRHLGREMQSTHSS